MRFDLQSKFEQRPWLLLLMAAVFLFPFLGNFHLFDWDEINFAESAREMLASGNFSQVTVNYEPFWEKPPLFIWCQVVSMKLFGVNEWAARFPNVITGLLSLSLFIVIGRQYRNLKFGVLWGVIYIASLLPQLYFRSGIMDPLFNLFIFCSIYGLYRLHLSGSIKWAIIAGAASGLAILTKGPVGFLLLLLTFLGFSALTKFKNFPGWKYVVTFSLSLFVVSSIWYVPELLNNGLWFFKEFISYQWELLTSPVAGHEQPFFYHFAVLLVGCFPMSIIGLPGLFRLKKADPFQKWMLMLFWVVLLLFSLVTTKILHYSSLAYFPLSFIAACLLSEKEIKWPRYQRWLFLIIGSALALLFVGVPILFANQQWLELVLQNDGFALASAQTEMNWNGWEWMTGLPFTIALVIASIAFYRNNFKQVPVVMAMGLGVTFIGYAGAVVPKIERFTQGPHIDFLQELKGRDVYVAPIGFHSYATFFYFEVPPGGYGGKTADQWKSWLIYEQIDKPAYFVTKRNNDYLDQFEQIELVRQEGGFKLYFRSLPNGSH